jgi:hypothetical protein
MYIFSLLYSTMLRFLLSDNNVFVCVCNPCSCTAVAAKQNTIPFRTDYLPNVQFIRYVLHVMSSLLFDVSSQTALKKAFLILLRHFSLHPFSIRSALPES